MAPEERARDGDQVGVKVAHCGVMCSGDVHEVVSRLGDDYSSEAMRERVKSRETSRFFPVYLF